MKSQGLFLSWNSSQLKTLAHKCHLGHMAWALWFVHLFCFWANGQMQRMQRLSTSKDHFCHRKGNVPIDWFSASSDLVLIGCIDLVWVIAKSFTWREDLACRFSCYWHGALEASHLFRSLHNLLLSCPYKKM